MRYISEEGRERVKKGIKRVVEQIDELHTASSFGVHKGSVLGSHVAISGGFPMVVERSWNPARSGELFEELYDLLKDHLIAGDVYRRLAGAFEELGIKPKNQDLERILEHARRAYGYHACPTYEPRELRATRWLEAHPLSQSKERE